MGMVFGPIFSSSFLSSSIDHDQTATFKQKVVAGWKDMYKAGLRMAKTFAVVGLVYSATECTIEKARGAHDYKNGLYAGCVAGGILGASGGPASAAVGCAGFAAFSLGIDYFMTDTDPRDFMIKDKDLNQMLIREKEENLFKAYERQAELLDEIDIDTLGLTPEQLEELDRIIEAEKKE
uniref:Mitochondrial import inner membrane translocase subunit TIM22 n=1 Tax=Vannella robusta TaxID=1487602 RepID=A0A7S4IUS5_9EUKA